MLITAAMHIASHRVPCGMQTGRRRHDSDTYDSMLTMRYPTSNTISKLTADNTKTASIQHAERHAISSMKTARKHSASQPNEKKGK